MSFRSALISTNTEYSTLVTLYQTRLSAAIEILKFKFWVLILFDHTKSRYRLWKMAAMFDSKRLDLILKECKNENYTIKTTIQFGWSDQAY